MRLSRKGRFAVTAMMNLALNNEKGPLTLTQLTQDQGISLSYLEQIFSQLRNEGLVSGVRGPGGGYCLARPIGEISIADIVTAIDGKAALIDPDKQVSPHNAGRSPSHVMWNKFSTDLYSFINGISLADCVARYNQQSGNTKTRKTAETEAA